MNESLALVSDLMFGSKIEHAAKSAGVNCTFMRDLPDALANVFHDPPELILVDLDADGIEPPGAIHALRTQYPDARIVAFGPHVQTEMLEQAKSAGADEVLPRSAFVQRLPKLFQT